MKFKMKLKMGIDFLMTVLLLLLMAYQWRYGNGSCTASCGGLLELCTYEHPSGTSLEYDSGNVLSEKQRKNICGDCMDFSASGSGNCCIWCN